MIEIWAGGQTGVDLGAHLQALDLGCAIAGFMPADGRNEDGPIPYRVAFHLRRHDRTGKAARTRANVASADAALIIVQDRRRTGATPGTALTIGLCEKRWPADARLLVVDPAWDEAAVKAWARAQLRGWQEHGGARMLRLLVAGPRASMWAEAEQEARRFTRVVLEVARHG